MKPPLGNCAFARESGNSFDFNRLKAPGPGFRG